MSEEKMLENVKRVFPDFVTETRLLGKKRSSVTIKPDRLRHVASYVKDELGFDVLVSVGGIDEPHAERFYVVYYLWSSSKRTLLMLKVNIPRNKPSLPSLTDIWETADYHERETWEMFGVDFIGHPNLTKLLLPEDWNEGYPLRKDFEFKFEEGKE